MADEPESLTALLDRMDAEDRAVADYLNPGTVLRHSPFRNALKVKAGLPTLDDWTEGGLPFGATICIVGPPGVGKTTLAIQLAREAREQHGAAVTAAFYDEGTEGAALKLGQQIGLDYEALRNGDEDALQRLEDYCPDAPEYGAFQFAPTSRELARVIDDARRDKIKSHPLVLLTDTLQKARFELPDAGPNGGERFRIEGEVVLLRNAALTIPALNLMTAEAARGAYASRDPSKRTTGLAAGAESRAIEYGCDLLLVLTERADSLVDVEVAKNRLGRGRKGHFLLRHDRARALYVEVETDPEQEEERDRERAAAKWSADERRVTETVRQYPGNSGRMLRELLRMNADRLGAVLEKLHLKSKLRMEKKGAAHLWYPALSDSGGGDPE